MEVNDFQRLCNGIFLFYIWGDGGLEVGNKCVLNDIFYIVNVDRVRVWFIGFN